MNFDGKGGFIWDIDGVVVDSPHEEAWRATAAKPEWGCTPVDTDFYLAHVASRPRHEGANEILERGGAYDKLGLKTQQERGEALEEFCAQKNALIRELIAAGEFGVFEDAVELLLQARSWGIPQAAASASKNAGDMLSLAPLASIAASARHGALAKGETLRSLFDVDVCGLDSPGGKADLFRMAAARLHEVGDCELAACVVFEDAPAGVRAARDCGIFAVGVVRIGTAADLRSAGAHIVVESFRELSLETLKDRLDERFSRG